MNERFTHTGTLRDICVGGASGEVHDPLLVGARLEISIELPTSEHWMIYKCEVIRVENGPAGVNFALKFETSVPTFKPK